MNAALTRTDSDMDTRTAEALAAQPSGTIGAFSSDSNFSAAQRMAKALAASSLVPEAYRNNIPNVLIAMELASRIGASVFAVCQNMDIIHGRPSMRATFLIATVNACGRFTPLRFRFTGKEGTDEWGCRAYAKDRESGEECVGSLITIALAKAEGWAGKSGSKWKTMPEQMLMYRAASFWTRVYAPEQSLGMQTADEAIDVHGYSVDVAPSKPQSAAAAAIETALMGPVVAVEHDPETGEIVPPAREPGVD
ncbi:MAG TPA: recombinase RecT [Gemmatimonadaceae bacterium]|nr:recombinase RecT [Gemmatimonadaceae bacterium]